MPDTFNLADDPWIPLLTVGGRRRRLVSLRDALVGAHEWAGYPDDDGQFGPAVLRLLAALTYSVSSLGSAENEADHAAVLATLRQAGCFNRTRANDYFDKWREAFWLFPPTVHDGQRWMQDSSLSDLPPATIAESRLMPHASPSYAWGNQSVEPPGPAAAARALLAFMHYGPSGYGAKHPDAVDKNQRWQDGRLRGRVSAHPCGATLFETLLLHTVPVGDDAFECVGFPEWEQERPPVGKQMGVPVSLLEQLTGRWEKAVWLHQAEGGTVQHLCITTGRRRPDGIREADPYTVMLLVKRKEDDQFVPGPLRTRPGRAIWRDFPSLREQADTGEHHTHILRSLSSPRRKPDRARIVAWVFAAHTPDKAKDNGWTLSNLAVKSLLDDSAEEAVDRFVTFAEKAATQLRRKASDYLAAAGYRTDQASGKHRLQRADTSFWSSMEATFRMVVAVPEDAAAVPAAIARAAVGAYDEAAAGGGAAAAAEYRDKLSKPSTMIPIAVARQRHRHRLDTDLWKLAEKEYQHG